MPHYTFRNTKTDEVFDDTMKISELESYLKENPHIVQVLKPIMTIDPYRLGRLRTANAFRDNMKQVKQNNPGAVIDTGNLGEI